MQITQQPILEVLAAEKTRYVIPVFQRVYSWTSRQCEELWDDIMSAGKAGEEHFMGMVLFMHDPDAHGDFTQVDVIDGQQRMTTMMLLLSAVCPGEFALAPLVLSEMDRATLDALVAGDDLPEEPAERLVDNYLLFAKKAEEPGFDADAFRRGLGLLEVASVALAAEDSPQLVFESLNSKGLALTTADRVRNLVIASTRGDEQERLYEQRWLPLEERAAQADAPTTVTDFLHAWLVERYRAVRIFDPGDIYGLFKTCLRDEFGGSLDRALASVAEFGDRYLSDAEYRAEVDESAAEWAAGKPEKSVSEYKLFGD